MKACVPAVGCQEGVGSGPQQDRFTHREVEHLGEDGTDGRTVGQVDTGSHFDSPGFLFYSLGL